MLLVLEYEGAAAATLLFQANQMFLYLPAVSELAFCVVPNLSIVFALALSGTKATFGFSTSTMKPLRGGKKQKLIRRGKKLCSGWTKKFTRSRRLSHFLACFRVSRRVSLRLHLDYTYVKPPRLCLSRTRCNYGSLRT